MGVLDDCVRIVKESIRGLGGLDIIVSNAVSLFAFPFGRLGGCVSGDVAEWLNRAGRKCLSLVICTLCRRRIGTRYVLRCERVGFGVEYVDCSAVLGG